MATRKTKTKVKTKVKVSKNQPVLTITHRPFLTRASPSPLRGRLLRSRSHWLSANGHGKPRLGSIQSLNLALFICAQDNGVLGGIQVQSHDIHQLLFEMGVVADLETHYPMGLQPIQLPYALPGRQGPAPSHLLQALPLVFL